MGTFDSATAKAKTAQRPPHGWFTDAVTIAQSGRQALRKTTLRADMRVYVGEASNFTSQNDLAGPVKSLLTAAIISGIDVIGLLSAEGPHVGWMARDLALKQDIDLWVVPGQDYATADKINLLVFNLKQALPPALTADKAIRMARQNGGFVIAAQLSSQRIKKIESLGPQNGPHAIEIYCANLGGFEDHDFGNFPRFVSSGAKSAKELEDLNTFTLISRDDIEAMGLLPEGAGENYEPGYLSHGNDGQVGSGGHIDPTADRPKGILPQPSQVSPTVPTAPHIGAPHNHGPV